MPQFLTDDELLDVPLGNLTPGELARSFKAHAAKEQKVEEIEAGRGPHLFDRQSEQDRKQEEQEALHHREEIVLAQLAEREAVLREEAERMDERAIKLHDGRRAYVDGEDYRDAEGHKLTGADRAQAEVLHVSQPHATTWQQQQEFTKAWAENQTLRRNIEAAQAGAPGTNEKTAVGAAEAILGRTKIDALPDYGSGDLSLSAPAMKF